MPGLYSLSSLTIAWLGDADDDASGLRLKLLASREGEIKQKIERSYTIRAKRTLRESVGASGVI